MNPLEKRIQVPKISPQDVQHDTYSQTSDIDSTGDQTNLIEYASAGGSTVCAINSNDGLHCWKYKNDYNVKIINVPVDMVSNVYDVAVNDNIICTLNNNDKLQCFNPNGPDIVCINGSTKQLSISLNQQMVCAINHYHQLECWNLSNYRNKELPGQLKGKLKYINVGDNKLCAIHTDTRLGLVTCWDYYHTFRNSYGEDNVDVTIGDEHICLLKDDRNLQCQIEELGLFKTVVPQDQTKNTMFVTNSNYITAAIDQTGILRIWKNLPKQNENSIVTFEGQMNGFASFKKNLLCAVNSLKNLKCWMLDPELEYHFMIRLTVPFEFSQNISKMQVGHNNICAINTFGNAKCWWQNYDYRINEFYQFKIPNGYKSGAKLLAPGQQFNCGIDQHDFIFCWSNEKNFENKSDIEHHFSDEQAKFLAVDGDLVCQVNLNDDLKCYKFNEDKQIVITYDQIGSKSNENVTDVTDVSDVNKFITLSINNDIVCTLSVSNDLECFRISENLITDSDNVHKVYRPSKSIKQKDVSVGDTHICAIDENGKLTCWIASSFSMNVSDAKLNECCVCYEDDVYSGNKVRFQCGHWVCIMCEVAISNKICPMCRTPYKIHQIIV